MTLLYFIVFPAKNLNDSDSGSQSTSGPGFPPLSALLPSLLSGAGFTLIKPSALCPHNVQTSTCDQIPMWARFHLRTNNLSWIRWWKAHWNNKTNPIQTIKSRHLLFLMQHLAIVWQITSQCVLFRTNKRKSHNHLTVAWCCISRMMIKAEKSKLISSPWQIWARGLIQPVCKYSLWNYAPRNFATMLQKYFIQTGKKWK